MGEIYTSASNIDGSLLQSKTILIFGATRGLGLDIAKKLAPIAGHIIISSRCEESCRNVAGLLSCESTFAKFSYQSVDFADFSSIRKFAINLKSEVSSIDFVINCISSLNVNKDYTEDGLEMNFGVNVVAPFLLINELKPLIAEGGRFLNYTGNIYNGAHLDMSNLALEKPYNMYREYSQSELAVLLFLKELSKREKSFDVCGFYGGYSMVKSYHLFGEDFCPFESFETSVPLMYAVSSSKAKSGYIYSIDEKGFPVEHAFPNLNGHEVQASILWEKLLALTGIRKIEYSLV